MKVIINADDLGYSVETDDAIFTLMEGRRITSATLLANGPAFGDAVKRIPLYPDCSFGVHLNITEFPSLTRPQVFYDEGRIDEEGTFAGETRAISPSPAMLDAVLKEWGRQVESIMDAGVRVSHFDSHHHMHTLPWLLPSLKALQKKFGVRKVRGTLNWYGGRRPPLALMLRKGAWRWFLRNYYMTRTTDYFIPFVRLAREANWAGIGGDSTVELMCHPGHPYFPGQKYSADEKELLWSDWARRSPAKVRLISYDEL